MRVSHCRARESASFRPENHRSAGVCKPDSDLQDRADTHVECRARVWDANELPHHHRSEIRGRNSAWSGSFHVHNTAYVRYENWARVEHSGHREYERVAERPAGHGALPKPFIHLSRAIPGISGVEQLF